MTSASDLRAASRARWFERRAVWVAVTVVGVVVHLALMLGTAGFVPDMGTFGQWGRVLREHPLLDFYAILGAKADHLPGDLLLHAMLARAAAAFDVLPGQHGYTVVLKVIPALADVVVAVVAWTVVRGARREDVRSQFFTFATMLWAPSLLAVSVIWGQWDAVSMAGVLIGLALLWSRAWWIAPAFFGWACLMKPQLALVAFILWGAWLITSPRAGRLGRTAVSAGVGVVSVAILAAPFGVGIPTLGARYSLEGRIAVARDRWHLTSMGATNIWQFHVVDDSERFVGLSYGAWGSIVFAGCVGYLAVIAYRQRTRVAPLVCSVWLSGMVMFSYYSCATRCHKRYLLPACVLLTLHVGLGGWRWRRFLLPLSLSVVMLASIVLQIVAWPAPASQTLMDGLSAATILLFVLSLIFSRPARREGERSAKLAQGWSS